MSTVNPATTLDQILINQAPAQLVTIGQVQTHATTINTGHDVEAGIGTCTLRVPVLWSWIVVGASVTVQMGYADTGTHPAFIGTVIGTKRVFSENGWEFQVDCDGQLARLVDSEEDTIQFPKIYLGDLARSLAGMRGVEPLLVDRIKSPIDWELDTKWIILGGNSFVDDGHVVIGSNQGLYSWLQQKLKLFGYHIFDRPAWDVKVGRVWGTPVVAQHTATEGVDIFRADRSINLQDMKTYWKVEGSSYTDADGIPVKFISIPLSVPYDDRLRPKGYRPQPLSDGILSSQFLVDTVRQIQEINYSQPGDFTTWEMPGSPLIQPGDVISITSEVMGHTDKKLWIMSVRHQLSEQGYFTSIEAWAGHGVALPDGNDAVTVPVVTGPVHIGDETVPWYAQPSPTSKEVVFDIVIPDEYTALIYEFWGHGCNSYFLQGASSESTVSKITVEQEGEEVGSAELPMQPENYEQRLPYGDGLQHWVFNRIPIPGRLKAGNATVRITSGQDNRLPASTRWDDFEMRDGILRLTGVGRPDLPEPKG